MKSLLALSILAAAARAGEVCHTTEYPSSITNWSQTLVVPKHDPALGALQSVTITLGSTLTGSVQAENPSPLPALYEALLRTHAVVWRPDASEIVRVVPSVASSLQFGGYDGTLDFAGASGITLTGLVATREWHVVLQDPADLALFSAASAGDTIALAVHAVSASIATGPGPLIVAFGSTVSARITVCYGYAQVRQTAVVPATPTNWQQAAVFARHDPSLGPLRAVQLRARTVMNGAAACENPGAVPEIIDTRLRVQTSILRPDASPALTAEVGQRFVDWLAAFDGTIDFGGTSGTSHASASALGAAGVVLTSPADLALFTAGSPGQTIALQLRADGSSIVQGGGAILSSLQTSAAVEVDLRYDHSAPVVPFCFGDGSGTACPCGNASPAGAQQGCLNSLALGGELRGTGAAEIGADTLVLSASNLPSSVAVLFFQGTSAIATAFGDGLRCAGGTLRRLGTRTASGGVATYPPAGSSVSVAGGATAGTTLRYQAWYRNAAAFCTSATFNLTNGLSIAW
jgi:hypothetical protein